MMTAPDNPGDAPPVDARALKACGALLAAEAARFASFGWMRGTSAEALVHARIAAASGAGAVVHLHSVPAVTAGRWWPSGVELKEKEMLKAIGVPAEGVAVRVPVVPNSQDMGVLSDRVERSRDPRVPAVIVAGHGLYAWGRDLRQARHHTEAVTWLLELALATR